MNITKTVAGALITLIDKFGLYPGAGSTDQQFCIQQAVAKVTTNNKEESTDHPGWCVMDEICNIGISLNDNSGWENKKARAEGLKRLAVAELGSNKLDSEEFMRKLCARLKVDRDEIWEEADNVLSLYESANYSKPPSVINKEVADACVEVLKEMGSEGCKFLYLLDEPDKKTAAKTALEMGKKIYAAQLAEMGYSAWKKPEQVA